MIPPYARKYVFAFCSFMGLLVAWQFLSFSQTETEADKVYQQYFQKNYKIFSVHLPDSLDFAGEPVPLNEFDIRERLDREILVNTYWQSNTLLFHKRAYQWFPVIEPILKKEGVPDDFKYLAVIESGLMQVVSPSGATGFWQILESTGQHYGLEVSKEVDERYHIEKATIAACKYLKEAYSLYNNWTLAAASYNMGMNGLSKQLERQQVNSYYDLYLNSETERYVLRIAAIKEILSNPQKYGFYLRKQDLYPPLKTYEVAVDSTVKDWAAFAKAQGINYKLLKIFNPWLRQTSMTNTSKKKYTIKLPEKGFIEHDNLLEAAGVRESDKFYQLDVQEMKEEMAQSILHIAKAGETVASLAKKYKVSEKDLRTVNHLKETDAISENQKIIIPNTITE